MFSGFWFVFCFYGVCICAICCDGGKDEIKKLYREFTVLNKVFLSRIVK
jgi:hypothetical protein